MYEVIGPPFDRLVGPMVATVAMGYGHLRAAMALADHLGEPVARVDQTPLAGRWENLLWGAARRGYEVVSRLSQRPLAGALCGPILEAATRIPEPGRGGDAGSRLLSLLVRGGLGAGMVAELLASGRTLVTTFYAPAVAAAHAGVGRVLCVVTDTDIHPIWAPDEATRGGVLYLAPTARAAERLTGYGVPPRRVLITGFPLPGELLGGPALPVLRADLARRLIRLDPRRAFLHGRRDEIEAELGPLPAASPAPLHLAVAVGGAGAQTGAVRRLLLGLAPAVRGGRLRITLVAGDHRHLRRRFAVWAREAGLGDRNPRMKLLSRDTFDEAYRAFNDLLHDTDLLWTKPSELVFYAALGLPLLLAPAVGDHEHHNAGWLMRAGGALRCPDPGDVWRVLAGELDSGGLARRAWEAYRRLPRRGLYRCVEAVRSGAPPPFTSG